MEAAPASALAAARPQRVDVAAARHEHRIDVRPSCSAGAAARTEEEDAGPSGPYVRVVTPTMVAQRDDPGRARSQRRRRPRLRDRSSSRLTASSGEDERGYHEHAQERGRRRPQESEPHSSVGSSASGRRRRRMRPVSPVPSVASASSSSRGSVARGESNAQLLSTASSAVWKARLNPRRDLRLWSNRFRDERLEESYQLYTSTCDFPVTRRLMLSLLVFELVVYLMYWRLADACLLPTGADSDVSLWSRQLVNLLGEQEQAAPADLTAKCIRYGDHATDNDGMTALLWTFAPPAAIFGLLPLKFFEGFMQLRIGVYYVRRHWKAIATTIVLVWGVGLTIFMHHALVKLRSNMQASLTAGLVCSSNLTMPLTWYEESNWIELHGDDIALDLFIWILIYDSKLTYSLVMGALAVAASFGGIVAIAMKLNFPHVLVLSIAQWLATVGLIVFGPPMSVNSRTVHNLGNQTLLFFLCVFIPTCFTLMATYSEDRAARMAYASKVRAERINTTLKLDLSVKQIGLENRSVTGDEKEAVQRALHDADGDMDIVNSVAIPFADLKLKELIAKTPYGEVILGEYHSTAIVVKRIALACLNPDGLADFKIKVELLASLRHPNIVLFIGATFDNLANVGMVLEYLERGDVLSLLRSPIALSWSDPLLKIATDVAQGAAYLHNCDPPLVHRDLKSSNLLCTPTFACKISDFGESKRQSMPGRLFSTIVGTPYWLAPEILREEKYDTQVDCYSFGIILIELETRRDPYFDLKNHTTIDIMMRVARGDLRPTIPSDCSPRRRDLIVRCLDNNPARRPKMTDILHALQHEVRQELVQGNPVESMRDKRRKLLMQRHQRLNRTALQDVLQSCED